jgi:AraC-like DNA-binding protein
VTNEQEGTMYIGEEFARPEEWREHLTPMREISDWWTQVSPFDGQTARLHRTRLQTIIKRRQYPVLGGYVTRALRTETEINRACFGFVPLLIEAVWSQHAELSLTRLTEELNLNEMTRRPREALMSWIASLQPRLRACPTAMNAEPIERVIAGIQADCSLPYSQANLSRSLGLTPAYFCRLFHEKTGQHFSAFLTRTRMEKAQELLAQPGERTLQDVSQSCGYPNKSYFCQVFKKYTGMTPGEYEQQRKNPS